MIKYVCPNCENSENIIRYGIVSTNDYGHFDDNGNWVESNPIEIEWEVYTPQDYHCLACGHDFIEPTKIKE